MKQPKIKSYLFFTKIRFLLLPSGQCSLRTSKLDQTNYRVSSVIPYNTGATVKNNCISLREEKKMFRKLVYRYIPVLTVYDFVIPMKTLELRHTT